MELNEKLIHKAAETGVELSHKQAEQLGEYYRMMVEKNKVMNLTAITEEDEVITKHFVDSLSLVRCLDPEMLQKELKVIDVGTGAGLPGMVLKIAFPAWKITLFDSLKKRLNFLDEVIRELGLEEIRTVHGRAEDYGRQKEYRDSYDLAVSRAVANMAVLAEYCLPFVRKDGIFAAYKTAEYEEEMNGAKGALKKLCGKVERTESFVLPGTDIGRSLILIRKTAATPAAYPRKAGLPAKEPLR